MMKNPKSHYNKNYRPLARALRNDSTPAEVLLWTKVLRARKFYGYQFNRQFPIQKYIVDFACRKLKLIIEIDGYSHLFSPSVWCHFDRSLGFKAEWRNLIFVEGAANYREDEIPPLHL